MNDRNIIDAEVVPIEESANLPAVVDDHASNSEGIELPNRQDVLLAANEDRRCVATNSRGQRCRKFAIYGATVCRTHGGATKRVKEKARIRVENASNRLMGKLIDFAFDDTKPPDVQLRAIRDALDRSGLKPPAEVHVSPGERKPYETVFESIGGEPGAVDSHSDPMATGLEGDSFAQRDLSYPDREPAPAGEHSASSHTEPPTQPDTLHARAYTEGSAARYAEQPSALMPQGQAEAAADGRERDAQGRHGARSQPAPAARQLHITGMDAIRLANTANRDAGVFEEQRAIETPHKRYLRP